jgi:hypothetical protein
MAGGRWGASRPLCEANWRGARRIRGQAGRGRAPDGRRRLGCAGSVRRGKPVETVDRKTRYRWIQDRGRNARHRRDSRHHLPWSEVRGSKRAKPHYARCRGRSVPSNRAVFPICRHRKRQDAIAELGQRTDPVIQIREGCGRGRHRNLRHCVPGCGPGWFQPYPQAPCRPR